jgi:hypothetical protein
VQFEWISKLKAISWKHDLSLVICLSSLKRHLTKLASG